MTNNQLAITSTRIFEFRVPSLPSICLIRSGICNREIDREIQTFIRIGVKFEDCLLISPEDSRIGLSLVSSLDLIFSMKFLEYTPLYRINDFLSHLNLGERTFKGSLEAYSCKHTGTDKKLSLSLENEILDYLGKSSDTDSSSPAEFLLSRSSRKTLIYLVLTLSHMFPDYDFSAVNAHQFFTEESLDSFSQIFDSYMFEASKEWAEINERSPLLETVYEALDEVVKLSECEIYSYNPYSDADPFLEKGAIWSFSYFFYNRKLKRVVCFHFCCLSNLLSDGFASDNLSYEEEEIFDDMDL